MTQGESDHITKCLEIIQALEAKGQTFSVKITSEPFSFFLDTKVVNSTKVEKKEKKLSPSQQRRNLRRKEEFLKQKSKSSKENSTTVEQGPELTPTKEPEVNARSLKQHKCTLCDRTFSTENGLKIHRGKAHDTEKLRTSSSKVSPLKVSPLKQTTRQEQCECCGDTMSPWHQCEPPQKSPQPSECGIFCACNMCLPFPCENCNTRSSSTVMLERHKAKEHFNLMVT